MVNVCPRVLKLKNKTKQNRAFSTIFIYPCVYNYYSINESPNETCQTRVALELLKYSYRTRSRTKAPLL